MPRTGLLDVNKSRDAIGFAAVLNHYDLEPEKHGRKQVKIHCPFHDDHTPSCSINLEKGIFNCFGCPAEGNVFDFIAEMEGFTENPTYHAAKLGLEIVGADPAMFQKDSASVDAPLKGQRASKKAKASQVPPKPHKTSQHRAEASGEAEDTSVGAPANPVLDVELTLDPEHAFLAARNISPEQAEEFGVGYCARGIMRNRIAIPIHNAAGELVAYTGRWSDEEVPEKEPRYKLPKEFQKSLELFNLHRAAVMDSRFVVIVEGIWSVLRLHAAGVPTVALLGTSCSDTQAANLVDAGFRYAMLILDGDDAGRVAAPEVAHVLSQHLYVKTVVLPDGEKPDTMDEDLVNRLRR